MEKKYRKCLKKKRKEKEKNANCKMPERPYPEGGGSVWNRRCSRGWVSLYFKGVFIYIYIMFIYLFKGWRW